MLTVVAALHGGFDILLADVDMLLEKATSILSHRNVETMESRAGELSEGCRAIEPARNSTQYSQRSRMDRVPLTAKYTIRSSPPHAELSSLLRKLLKKASFHPLFSRSNTSSTDSPD